MDMIQEIIEKAMKQRYALLQEYILEYLEKTGTKIEELTLVEEIKDQKLLLYLDKKKYLENPLSRYSNQDLIKECKRRKLLVNPYSDQV